MRCGCSHEKTIKRKTSINTDNEHNNVCTCMCTVVRSIGMSEGIDSGVCGGHSYLFFTGSKF